jgi:hypothetical protein
MAAPLSPSHSQRRPPTDRRGRYLSNSAGFAVLARSARPISHARLPRAPASPTIELAARGGVPDCLLLHQRGARRSARATAAPRGGRPPAARAAGPTRAARGRSAPRPPPPTSARRPSTARAGDEISRPPMARTRAYGRSRAAAGARRSPAEEKTRDAPGEAAPASLRRINSGKSHPGRFLFRR